MTATIVANAEKFIRDERSATYELQGKRMRNEARRLTKLYSVIDVTP